MGMYDQEYGEGYTVNGDFSREQEAALIVWLDNWKIRTAKMFVFMLYTLGIGSLNSTEHISPTVYAGSVELVD